MKKTHLILGAALLAVLVLAVVFIRHGRSSDAPGSSGPPAGTEYYTCPMHPSVIAYKPGACPVCGMALVKKVAGERSGPHETSPGGEVVVSQEQRVRANITTSAVRRIPLSAPVSASGVVAFAEPSQSIVAARGRERVERLFVNRTGAFVRKGEPLLSVYSPELTAAVQEYLIARSGGEESTRAQLVAASRRRLQERFGLTESQINNLEQEPDAPAVYISPIAGTVIRKPVVEGQYVEEGATLFELADLSRVWVIASVPEQEIRSVRQGEPVDVTLDAYPGLLFRGRVGFVEPVLDPDSRTVRVRTELANPEGKLKPNMYARVTLKPEAREALVVPASAVLFTGRHPLVWVETGPGRFAPRVVTVGLTSGGLTEVLGGVEEGDMVAATGGFLIDSESRLEAPPGGEHAGHSM
ncbi:MAG TPA: efflux RND transporter periplasmic adaptor subunit [Bacteroidota bacterium]|nr:efflux RND transporter periplasmic adaptor subunit [Bacteroidota bacterium]